MMQSFYSPQTLMTWDIRAPGCMALQSIITATLICSTPKSSLLRKATLPILVYLSWVCVETASAFSLQLMLYLGFAVGSYVNVFHCFNLLCLHPLDDTDIRHELHLRRGTSVNPGFFERVHFTTAILWSFRGIGTTYQIKSLPQFAGGVVPSKRAFLFRQCVLIILQYLFMDLVTSQPQTPEAAESWAEGKEWLWLPLNPHPVTASDLLSRLLGTVMAWFLIGRTMLDIWYRVFSVIFVGLGISPVRQWPPLFGDYTQCFTLRRYFNKFWHQCLRWPLQDVATFMTRDLLGLRPTLLESYVTMGVIFFLSGHFHVLLDYCLGMRSWHLSGGIPCFILMLPGIMLEDSVQCVWRKFMSNGEKSQSNSWLERTVGYIWVILWMATVTPIYNFPLQRIENNPTYIIPWGIFRQSS